MKIDKYLAEGKISKIQETEKERYLTFFTNSYKENKKLAEQLVSTFPRWAIIAGYYAMHDSAKLLLAKHYNLKIDYNVHITTIEVLKEVSTNRELKEELQEGYQLFTEYANDLAQAKEERVKAQYYTGSPFMKEQYAKKAEQMITELVTPFIKKIEQGLG